MSAGALPPATARRRAIFGQLGEPDGDPQAVFEREGAGDDLSGDRTQAVAEHVVGLAAARPKRLGHSVLNRADGGT